MGHQKKIRLTLFAFAITSICFAQELVTVKGIVVDSAKLRPIAYVNVFVKKGNHGTTTDSKGNFTLSARPSDTIRFSFVGYRTLELPARDWEPSVIMMAEEVTILKTLTVHGEAIGSRYDGLFDEENKKLEASKKKLPFYYSKEKKEAAMLARAKGESMRVKHYVDLLVKDDRVKNELMKKHNLTENQYYDLLAQFNQKNYAIMYYLTDTELLTLLYRFYDIHADQ